MASRKWLIRSLYFAFLAALGGGGLIVYTWMRPEYIRTEVTKQLTEKFNNVDVEVGSAYLRILGGIAVNDLKLIRRDDPTRTPFLQVPSAILHYDKEQLNDGNLIIRKLELSHLKLRAERGTDGKWNLTGLLKPAGGDEPSPLFILHDATIEFVDRRFGEQPIAVLKDIEATIVNDPTPVFTFQVRGNGRPSGPFAAEGRFDRRSGFGGTIDLSNIAVGADLMRFVEALAPEALEYAKPLTGKATAHLDLIWQTDSAPALSHDLRIELTQGRYAHPDFPSAIEEIEVSFRSKNGDITIPKATARVGQGTLSATLDLAKEPLCAPKSQRLNLPTAGVDGSLAPDQPSFQDFEDRLRSLEIAVSNFAVTSDLFRNLPAKATMIRDIFLPSGPVGVSYSFTRHEGGWNKKLVIAPAGMEATYRGFPYKLRNVRGTIVHTASEGATDYLKIDLFADGGGTTASIKGTIAGSQPDVDVDLTIVGREVTLDEELIAAMPDDNPTLLRKLHATAFGDFTATIRHNAGLRRDYGPEAYDNKFTIALHKGSMKYDVFPYPLENMTGTLVVRTVPERPTRLPNTSGQPPNLTNADTTTLEFHDFRATHNGSRITGTGRKDPAPGGSILNLRIDAESLALDADLQRALAAIRMESAWKTFEPSGRINCAARVKLYAKNDDRIEINPAEDLEMGLAFAGGTIKPTFVPYVMHDLAGRVAYAKGRVELRDFRAKHGKTVLTLPSSEVLFRPSGGYWADLHDLHVEPLIIDQPFLAALPPGLRSACEGLELKGPMSLHATRMVIDDQPGPYIPHRLPGNARGAAPEENNKPNTIGLLNTAGAVVPQPNLPTIYWDGRIQLAGASLVAGVDWQNVHGTFASWGLYKGDRLGAVRGNVAFDRATVAKQPIESLTASLRVDPRQPDVLSVPAIRGKLYGGDIGGEAWVVVDGPVRYALQLNAARVRLSEIANQYKLPQKAHLEGLASAQLYLANRVDERTGKLVLQGGGAIDVPNGKLLNLPVLLNLIKVVKLRVPDETGFEEAHALFHINGNRLKFGQLDLIGNAISLGGSGEMNADGTDVHFEFYPVWTKMKEMFALPGEWSGAISKRFLKIRVSGELDGKLDYRAEPVPGLVDPVKRIFNRLK